MDKITKKKRNELLKNTIKIRRKQIEHFEKLFIKPLKDNIKKADMVIKNQLPLEHYLKHSKYVHNYITRAMNEIGKVDD